MTKTRSIIFLVAMTALALPASAQSRDQQQIFADLRILQEQVQQLRVAVNALAEQTKATNTRIDAQAEAARKNYADELQLVRELSASVEQRAGHEALAGAAAAARRAEHAAAADLAGRVATAADDARRSERVDWRSG